MADFNQFGSVRPSPSADAKHCPQFEAMLADAVDGTLSAEDQASFDRHMGGCTSCGEMLADAKRGAAWMEMLRQHTPEPPAAMLNRILAQTSGAATMSSSPQAGVAPGLAVGVVAVSASGSGISAQSNVLPFQKRVVRGFDLRGIGHTLLQPRLALTAAMAFFSIALTMDLTGVRLSELRVSDLKPSSLKRSMYAANAHVVRYYTNLRVVYELESRVHDLQRSTEDDAPATPANEPQSNSEAKGKNGTESDPKDKGKEPESQPRRRVSPGTSRREPLHENINPDSRVLAGTGISNTSATKMAAMLFSEVDLQSEERGTV